MEVTDLGGLLGDREVAVDEDLESAGGRITLVDAHRRLRRAEERVADPGRALGDLVGLRRADEVTLQLVEIEPGAEGSLTAADHHHAHVRIFLGPDAGLVELLEQLLADRVALVRSIQPDSRDVPVYFVLDRFDFDGDRHRFLPSVELNLGERNTVRYFHV